MKKNNFLTEREKQVISLAAKGKSYKQIGDELDISSFTVRSHLISIRKKLKASNTIGAVTVAIAHGVVLL